jgi:predicted O-linked N-acetylglucosamine transferase (SPINDLY family)
VVRSPIPDATPGQINSRFREGLALHQQGRLAEAGRIYQEILARHPGHFDACHLLGLVAAQTGQPEHAVDLIMRAITLDPNVAAAHSNLAKTLNDLKRYEEAVAACDTAIRLSPELAGSYVNRGDALAGLQRHEAALASYDRGIELDAAIAEAHNDRANTLQSLNRYEDAVASYRAAVALKPGYAEAYAGLGVALTRLRQHAQALASFKRAIALSPRHAEAHNNLGNLLVEMKRYDAAISAYATAMAINPDYEFILGTWLHTRMKICEWFDLDGAMTQLAHKLDAGEKVSPPFPLLSLPTTLEQQHKGAAIWSEEMFPSDASLPPPERRPRRRPLRVGYFSADFQNHATAWLIAGLFEQHDRANVEPIAFSFGTAPQDEMVERLTAGVDRFIDVRRLSDPEVAALARSEGIDIAVDLKGFTTESRTGIFAARAAPIQVNYLGYPGTMAAAYMDYLIADAVVVPARDRGAYSEKIVWLPDSYQVNDSRRLISERAFTRAECGLPPAGVVYCCFNANYKIVPQTFSSWMNILRQVDGSVLWLFADNPTAVANLRREAETRGVDADRLVFAQRAPMPEHLARHRVADLVLDTAPYNAHTTASDALWAGLPVLTCPGETFASRVAASLLNAVGLPELATSSAEDYEALAVELGRRPERLARLKRKLARQRLGAPLFDTERFARHIEAAYAAMYDRYQAGLPPDHIRVSRAGAAT